MWLIPPNLAVYFHGNVGADLGFCTHELFSLYTLCGDAENSVSYSFNFLVDVLVALNWENDQNKLQILIFDNKIC